MYLWFLACKEGCSCLYPQRSTARHCEIHVWPSCFTT